MNLYRSGNINRKQSWFRFFPFAIIEKIFCVKNSLFLKLLFLALLFPSFLFCRLSSGKFEQFGVQDGLSNSFITSMLQDDMGFLWIGTQYGLSKYDGYDFTLFFHEPGNRSTISDGFIRALGIDENDNLWIGTNHGGLNRMDLTTEDITHYSNDPEDPASLSHDSITAIAVKSPDIIWIGTKGGGVNRLETQTGRFTRFLSEDGLGNGPVNNMIRAMVSGSKELLWVGTRKGLSIFDQQENRWISCGEQEFSLPGRLCVEIISITEPEPGTLFIGTKKGPFQVGAHRLTSGTHLLLDVTPLFDLLKFPGINAKTLKKMKADLENITDILKDDSGNLWFSTHEGVYQFNTDYELITRYKHIPGDQSSISADMITVMLKDKFGNIWFGSGGNGISKLNRNASGFTLIRHVPGMNNSLSGSSIRGIYEDEDGLLWVGGYNGLNRLQRQTGEFAHYSQDILGTDLIYSILGDPDNPNILWLGTEGDGLLKFDKKTEKVLQNYSLYHKSPQYRISGDFVFGLCISKDGYLWLATNHGLNRINRKTGRVTIYKHEPSLPDAEVKDITQVVIEDTEGMLWIGTIDQGISRFDPETEKFTDYVYYPDDPLHSLNNQRIKCLYYDKDGKLWIGTNGGGLNYLETETGEFGHYTTEDGLPSNVVYGILEDIEGTLWISTNNGLSRFNPATGTFRNFDVADGLQDNEFNTASYFQNENGELFFGGIAGLNIVNPRLIMEFPPPPPVTITGFTIFNRTVPVGEMDDGRTILTRHITHAEEIRLSYSDDMFTVEFALVNFASPHKTKYAYKLTGIDDSWIFTDGKRRYATYTHIPPGEYIFQVVGSSKKIIDPESLPPTTIRLTITPPPWKSWWAYSLYTLIILFSGFGFAHYKIRRIKEKQRQQEETLQNLKRIDRLKSEALKAREKYQKLFEQSNDAIYFCDTRGVITDVNQSAEKLFGYEHRQLTGRNFSDLFRSKKEYTQFKKLLDSRKSLKDYKVYLQKKDGAPLCCLLTTTVQVAETGEISGYQGIIRDITKTLRAEEQIRLLSRGIESAGEAMVMTDKDGVINYVNPEFTALTGYTAEEVLGKNPRILKSGKHSRALYKKMWNTIRSGKVWQGEMVNRKKDGTYFDEILTIAPVYSNEGNLEGFVSIHSDITERKKVEKALKEAHDTLEQRVVERTAEVLRQKRQIEEQAKKLRDMDKIKSRFFANISHELRTPLMIIKGPILDIFQGKHGDIPSSAQKALHLSVRNIDRLQRLIDQMLDLSRLESGEIELKYERLELNGFIRRILDSFSELGKKKNLSIEFTSERKKIPIDLDLEKMEKIFYNLLSNAIKFTPKGGSILITTDITKNPRYENQVIIRVRDTGEGIPADDLPFIFDRFYQVDRHQTPYEGTGIGLSLVAELIELHGGNISVKSKLGVGTEFTIILPSEHKTLSGKLKKAGKPADKRKHPANEVFVPDMETMWKETEMVPLPENMGTVLVVEDNDDMRAYLHQVLDGHFTVKEAADGKEGLEKAGKILPDLIISDVMMPEMDGIQLCSAIRKDPILKNVPLILLTARADEQAKLKGLKIKADDYITKPFNADELKLRIRNLIDRQKNLWYELRERITTTGVTEMESMDDADSGFIRNVREAIEKHLADSDFNVETLAKKVFLSRRQLHRRIKDLTGITPTDLIRQIKLLKARHMIQSGKTKSVGETAYAVGFTKAEYFSLLFKEAFGVNPGDMIKQYREKSSSGKIETN